MPNHCIQLTADQRAFNVFSVSFCEVICNQRHQAAATDAGRFIGNKSHAEIMNTYFTINVEKNMNRNPVAQFTKPSEE